MEAISRAFAYYAVLRSLYLLLMDDFQLSSIELLNGLTSKVSNNEDE